MKVLKTSLCTMSKTNFSTLLKTNFRTLVKTNLRTYGDSFGKTSYLVRSLAAASR